MNDAVTASAPASIGNCAAGFDVLGQSFEGPSDRVTARRIDDPGTVRIASIVCAEAELPTDPERNTAGRAVQDLLQRSAADFGVELRIEKGIPLASGMGGSAASAVAAVVAANALLDEPMPDDVLYEAACEGEAVASGAAHGDNVGPCLYGGLVIAPRRGAPVRVPVPEWLHIALVHPDLQLETRRSREVMQEPFPLGVVTAQLEGLALVLSGCFSGDRDTIARGLYDVLAEPRRRAFVPNFAAVQQAALDHGALGASIAGGGPSVFGWFADRASAERGAAAMQRAFAQASVTSQGYVSPVRGPRAEVIP